MKIIWVKIGGLWPVDRGGRRRSFETLADLAKRHEVTLLTTHDAGVAGLDDAEGTVRALPGVEIVSFPWAIPKRGSLGFALALARSWPSPLPVDLWRCRVPALQHELARRLHASPARRPDVCVADFLAAAPNLPASSSNPVPVVLFEHNVEHQIWRRMASVETRRLRKALLEIEWRKLRRYEASQVARARRTITVSVGDRKALAALAPDAEVRAVATGVDSDYFHANGEVVLPASLAFVGAMDWQPNEDAMLHFCAEILPRVRERVPATKLAIIGRNPGPSVRALANGCVNVTGTVDDVRPHLGAAEVVVVPLRIGGGTRLKIFEAMAMGKPVVSTTIGAEGLPLVPGEHFVRADSIDEQAEAVVGLLGDPERRARLGAAGRKLVAEEFGWSRIARSFESELLEVVHAR